jgi:hypothetical protein
MVRHAAGLDLHLPPNSDEYKQFHATLEPLNNGSGAQLFFNALANLNSRQLFMTAEGRIGFTLCGVQPGDSVCILNGAWVPHVLRKVDDRDGTVYKFIGDAYVHGLMYGEADEMNVEVERVRLV